MIEKYYTEEQREQLSRRGRELGADAIDQAEREWSELIAAVKAEQVKGTDPASQRMTDLARRWQELIGQFTGGDEGLHRSLSTMYRLEGAEKASRGAFDQDLMQYIAKAIKALPHE